eukprot:3111508-Prymnesium_polylepis.1
MVAALVARALARFPSTPELSTPPGRSRHTHAMFFFGDRSPARAHQIDAPHCFAADWPGAGRA